MPVFNLPGLVQQLIEPLKATLRERVTPPESSDQPVQHAAVQLLRLLRLAAVDKQAGEVVDDQQHAGVVNAPGRLVADERATVQLFCVGKLPSAPHLGGQAVQHPECRGVTGAKRSLTVGEAAAQQVERVVDLALPDQHVRQAAACRQVAVELFGLVKPLFGVTVYGVQVRTFVQHVCEAAGRLQGGGRPWLASTEGLFGGVRHASCTRCARRAGCVQGGDPHHSHMPLHFERRLHACPPLLWLARLAQQDRETLLAVQRVGMAETRAENVGVAQVVLVNAARHLHRADVQLLLIGGRQQPRRPVQRGVERAAVPVPQVLNRLFGVGHRTHVGHRRVGLLPEVPSVLFALQAVAFAHRAHRLDEHGRVGRPPEPNHNQRQDRVQPASAHNVSRVTWWC
eukprot:363655-Chlamydomonas_euryale.AAC.12